MIAAGPGTWVVLALVCVAAGALLAAAIWSAASRARDRRLADDLRAQVAGSIDAVWTAGADLVLDRLCGPDGNPLPAGRSCPLAIGRPLWDGAADAARRDLPRAPAPIEEALRRGAPFADVLLVPDWEPRALPAPTLRDFRPTLGLDAATVQFALPERAQPERGDTPPTDAPDGPDAVARAAARRVLAGGQLQVWAVSGTPRRDADGRVAGWTGAARDVGALLAAGARAAAAGGDVQNRRLAALQAQFAERSRQFDYVVKELDSFAHTVSHDLRAPLRVVDGFATIVLEDYGARLDDVGRDHLKRIVAAAGRMNAMIDTLLALSRTTSRPLEPERVDLSRLAQELADEMAAEDRGRNVAFVITPGLVADGDRTLLRLVLQNLLGNAFKFSARTAAARIEFGRAEEALGAGAAPVPVWFVKDNGAGFDMRFADKLFGVFQRLHSQNEFPGTGVGLATVQRIVRAHGGRIWARSEPGRGATFCFTLWEHGAAPAPGAAHRLAA